MRRTLRKSIQWYTVVANSRQNAETIIFVLTFGLVGFTLFRSLFFDLAFQNETLYKVPSSRKSETKKERDHSYSSYLRTEKIRSRTVDPTTTVFRSHEILNAGEFKYDVIKFSDPALPFSLSFLVFTAHLICNCLFDRY